MNVDEWQGFSSSLASNSLTCCCTEVDRRRARVISSAISHLRSSLHFKMVDHGQAGPSGEPRRRQSSVPVATADDHETGVPAPLPQNDAYWFNMLLKVLNMYLKVVLIATLVESLHRAYHDVRAHGLTNACKSEGGGMGDQLLHRSVVQALRTGQYKSFASMLDNSTTVVIRRGTTVFAPSDETLSNYLVETTAEDLVRLHIVPGIVPYSDLLRLEVGSRLTTTACNVTIPVTNATAGFFQVDEAAIVEPDLYMAAATIAVHGINGVLNTTRISQGGLSIPAILALCFGRLLVIFVCWYRLRAAGLA